MFLQHQQFIIYDERTQRRFRGIYNPNLLHVILCTFLYFFLNVPRVLANAVIFSISPVMAIVLMLIELAIFILVCHKYSVPLNNNVVFPSGLVSALANYISVTGPFKKIGYINLVANILLIIKILLTYPIVYNETSIVDICDKPDVFRCWNMSEMMNHTCPMKTKDAPNITQFYNLSLASSRPFCSPNESPNAFLFQAVLPTLLGLICFAAIPFGFIIQLSMSKDNLSSLDKKIQRTAKTLLDFFSCKSKLTDDEDKHEIDESAIKTASEVAIRQNIDESGIKEALNESNSNGKKGKECFFGSSTLVTFFDNVRTIFSQGRIVEKNSKY